MVPQEGESKRVAADSDNQRRRIAGSTHIAAPDCTRNSLVLTNHRAEKVEDDTDRIVAAAAVDPWQKVADGWLGHSTGRFSRMFSPLC